MPCCRGYDTLWRSTPSLVRHTCEEGREGYGSSRPGSSIVAQRRGARARARVCATAVRQGGARAARWARDARGEVSAAAERRGGRRRRAAASCAEPVAPIPWRRLGLGERQRGPRQRRRPRRLLRGGRRLTAAAPWRQDDAAAAAPWRQHAKKEQSTDEAGWRQWQYAKKEEATDEAGWRQHTKKEEIKGETGVHRGGRNPVRLQEGLPSWATDLLSGARWQSVAENRLTIRHLFRTVDVLKDLVKYKVRTAQSMTRGAAVQEVIKAEPVEPNEGGPAGGVGGQGGDRHTAGLAGYRGAARRMHGEGRGREQGRRSAAGGAAGSAEAEEEGGLPWPGPEPDRHGQLASAPKPSAARGGEGEGDGRYATAAGAPSDERARRGGRRVAPRTRAAGAPSDERTRRGGRREAPRACAREHRATRAHGGGAPRDASARRMQWPEEEGQRGPAAGGAPPAASAGGKGAPRGVERPRREEGWASGPGPKAPPKACASRWVPSARQEQQPVELSAPGGRGQRICTRGTDRQTLRRSLPGTSSSSSSSPEVHPHLERI